MINVIHFKNYIDKYNTLVKKLKGIQGHMQQ